MANKDLTLTNISMVFAKLRFPDEETPIDVRSVFPPGEVDNGTNYKCLQILVAAAFEQGFIYRARHRDASDEDLINASIDYSKTVFKDKPDDDKSKTLMKWAFASGIICFDDKRIEVRGKTLTVEFDKDNII